MSRVESEAFVLKSASGEARSFATRKLLLVRQYRFPTQRLGKANRAKADHAALGPVEQNPPAIVGPVEVDLLVSDRLALDPIDGHRVHRGSEPAVTPVDLDAQIRDPMEDEGRWGDAKLRAAADAAEPLNDEINVQDEIARPVRLASVAGAQLEPPDVAIVPGHLVEV